MIDTWHVSGPAGDRQPRHAVSEVAVPRDHATSVITRQPLADGPLYAFPLFGLLALTIAGIALGIARAAIDDLLELAGGKTPTGSSRTLAERPVTQARIAQAEATLLAARAFLYDAIARAWEAAESGGEVSIEHRAALRLAATHATAASAAAVDTAYDLGGGTSIYETSPLQKRLPRRPRRHAAHAGRPVHVGAHRPADARASDGRCAALEPPARNRVLASRI